MSDYSENPRSRLQGQIGRGYLSGEIDHSGMMPKGKVKTASGRENEGIDIITPVGLSVDMASGGGTEVLTFDPNGDPSQRVAFPIGDRKKRRKAPKGGVSLYSPENPDNYADFGKDSVEIQSKDKPLNIKAKEFNFEGELFDLFKGIIRFENGELVVKAKLRVEGDVNFKGVFDLNGVVQVND